MIKRKPTVLIHIDETQRDMHTAYWISLWLEEIGFQTSFCNRATRELMWQILKPDIMIDSCFNYHSVESLKYRTKFTKYCVLPVEGAVINEELRLKARAYYFEGNEEICKYLTRAFIWGKRAYNALLKSGHFRPNQLALTGSPQYDAYMRSDLRTSGNNSKIGLMTMFKSINTFDDRNKLLLYDQLRGCPGDYYSSNRNVEDLVWYHCCGYRVSLDLIDHLIRESDCNISIRPHHNENPNNYGFIADKYPGRISIDYRMPFFQWLRTISAAVVCKSTAISESIVAGVPVMTIENLMGNRVDDHVTIPDIRMPILDYIWKPKTYKEAVDLCIRARDGGMPVATDLSEANRFVYEYFYYPREHPSTYSIAKEIAHIYREDYSFFRRKKREPLSMKKVKAMSKLSRLKVLSKLGRVRYGDCYSIKNAGNLRKFWKANIYDPGYDREIESLRVV